LHEIILEKNNPKTPATLPKAFKEAVNQLKSINLQIKGLQVIGVIKLNPSSI
jgi:hypothetical protein